MNTHTKRMTVSAVMLALSTSLALLCAEIPFLHLPFGGGFTIAGMLPVILVGYLYGAKWGFAVSFSYAAVQVLLGVLTGAGYIVSLFTVGSDDYMGVWAGVGVLFLDYIAAYTVLGFGCAFRRRLPPARALVCGVLLALSLRYLMHILSGAIFFGVWAEWFFSQDGFAAFGEWVLSHFSGVGLALFYSVFYNGLFMLPEMLITSLVALPVSRLPMIKKEIAD